MYFEKRLMVNLFGIIYAETHPVSYECTVIAVIPVIPPLFFSLQSSSPNGQR